MHGVHVSANPQARGKGRAGRGWEARRACGDMLGSKGGSVWAPLQGGLAGSSSAAKDEVGWKRRWTMVALCFV